MKEKVNFPGVVSPFTATAERLSDGETLEIKRNAIKDGKHLSFTADLDRLGDGTLLVGHGFEATCGSWIEITRDKLSAYSFYSFRDPARVELIEPVDHGVEIKGFISVVIDADFAGGGYFVVIASAGGMFKLQLPRWSGQDGTVFVRPVGCSLSGCKLNWFSDRYASKIWVIGDSYLSFPDPARWPTYLYRDGYAKNVLLSGFSGMSTQRGLEEFKSAIEKGNPEYCAWCVGMNNGDSKEDGTLNKDWLACTEEFLAICKARGITPVLSTIPTTPKVNNRQKSAWVRASGYRYIDFARAVGSDKDAAWYPEMLFTDQVHPAKNGAQALYMQVLSDFPEIMQR